MFKVGFPTLRQNVCQEKVGEKNEHGTRDDGCSGCFTYFYASALDGVTTIGAYTTNYKCKEETLDDAVPYEPFGELVLEAVGEVFGVDDIGKPPRGVCADDAGSDAESDQKRNHGNQACNLGKDEEVGRVDSHDFEGINLLGYPHGANFGSDVRAYLAGQDETHDGRGELQQHDFAGGVSHNKSGHPRTFDVQLDLDGDDGSDEEGDEEHDADGVYS